VSRLSDERVRALLAAATPGPIDVHRCDADGGAIDYQLQRGPGTGGAVLGYATDHDGSPRAKADAMLWSHASDLAADLLDAHAALATERERRERAEAAVVTLAKIVAARLPTAQRWLLEQVRRGTDMETPLHKSGEVKIAGLCSRGATIAALASRGLVEVGGFCAEIDGDGFTVRDDATWYAITPAGRAALAGCP